MTYLRQEALDTFKEYLLDINMGSGLSTKTASEIASKLVIGLYEPIFAQIDPIRLGETNAALQIATEYGNRLLQGSKSLKSGALLKLVQTYPTHGFVIDRAEARQLFETVQSPSDSESMFASISITLSQEKSYKSRARVLDLVELVGTMIRRKDLEKNDEKFETAADHTITSSPGKATGAKSPRRTAPKGAA